MADITMIQRTLEVFCQPGQVMSIQAYYGQKQGECLCTTNLDEAVRFAAHLEETRPLGVYFIPNPVDSSFAGTRQQFPKNENILCRQWLLIDADPERPSGSSASQEEKEAARRTIKAVSDLLTQTGLRGAVKADSGNGWHLCYPIDCPNDSPSREFIRDILCGLHKRFGDTLSEREETSKKAKHFLETPKTKIDSSCHDAKRIWKLYGTTARKGTNSPERLHRQAKLLDGHPWKPEEAEHNTRLLPQVLRAVLETYEDLDQFGPGYKPSAQSVSAELAYCLKVLHDECREVASAAVGSRNEQLNKSSFAVGQFIGPNRLSYEQSLNSLYLAALDAGCDAPHKDKGTIARGLKDGMKQPRQIHLNGQINSPTPVPPRPNADTSSDPLDQDATAADLILANATIRWGWDKWLQFGVLNVLASEPGIGKTRFCADLARRVFHALPWPDGAEAFFPKGSPTLWVPADNQHAELATLAQTFGFPPENLYLNATRRNPFAGTMLDDSTDLKDFEARIRRIRPALVFVDTSLNATDRSAHKPEDAKAFFVPLQQIAVRTGAVMVMVTHLNAGGKPLGRRIMGQARLVMQLEKPDVTQEHRRKLYVVKSNSLYPAPLGVTMGELGNEYDLNPPEAPPETPSRRGPSPEKTETACKWLQEALKDGPKRVHALRTEAEMALIGAGTLYRAKEELGIEQFESEGKKWWRLTSD